MRRTRRKPRVVWLPLDPFNTVQPTQGSGVTAATDPILKHYQINVSSASDITQGTQFGQASPVVGDASNSQGYIIGNADIDSKTFSDLFNSGYRLRRLVGQIACSVTQTPDAGGGLQGSVALCAGFQVMRVDSSGFPVDTQAANTLAYNTTENPWIWRRTWFLTNFASSVGVAQPAGSSNNFGGGSMREGMFIDQKTARIVGPDERLFFCSTVEVLNLQSVAIANPVDFNVDIWTDLRVLASLKSNVGNRRNSSR